jgi:hypothetical protein
VSAARHFVPRRARDDLKEDLMLDRTKGPERPAELRYLSGEFQVVKPGTHVYCAVTGKAIPLEELRYWSAELQEAYASAEIATRRAEEVKAKRRA